MTPFSAFTIGVIIVFTLRTIYAFVHGVTRGVYVRDLRLRKAILCRGFCRFSAGPRVCAVFAQKHKAPNPRHPAFDDRSVRGTIVAVNRHKKYNEFLDRRSKIKSVNGSSERRMYFENKTMRILGDANKDEKLRKHVEFKSVQNID